jgi:hypothetical protein
MTAGLSFLFQAKIPSAETLVGALSAPPPHQKKPSPDILHYIWTVAVPQVPAPEGYFSVLLTTVYDENFTAYIGDLVKANPGPFNAAAKGILGFEGIDNRLPDPDALQEFIALIAARDLTQTSPIGKPSFIPFYPFTAAAIHKHMGGGPAPSKPRVSKPKGSKSTASKK